MKFELIKTVSAVSASAVACLVTVLFAESSQAQGISLRAVGSVNESMAGAGTALPLSPAGALHWNPASIAEFKRHQAEMGFGLVYPDSRVSSTVGMASGSSRSESGIGPLPTMALVLKNQNPRITTGIGLFAIAGFKLNYDASTTNPIHLPQGALGALPTLGRVNTEAEFFQIVPTLAYTINDCWSIGAAPTITVARLGIEPLLATGPGVAGIPTGSGSRFAFGGGGQFGVYYKPNQKFSAGLSVKTEQYFEDFRFKSTDNATGAPIRAATEFEYPMIISLGTAYRFSPRTSAALDIRYFDYGQAEGFGTTGFKPDGSLAGLAWASVMAVAGGVSHQVSEKLTLRGGYVYNENPIPGDQLLINSAAPLIMQHVASIGFETRVHPCMRFATTYLHGFDSSQSGLYAGVPGTDITTRLAAYIVSMSVMIDF